MVLHADIDAYTSVLSYQDYVKLVPGQKLKPIPIRLLYFNRRPILTIGSVQVSVNSASYSITSFPFVVVKHGNSIMGIDYNHALGYQSIPPLALEFETPIPNRYLADSTNLGECILMKQVSFWTARAVGDAFKTRLSARFRTKRTVKKQCFCK